MFAVNQSLSIYKRRESFNNETKGKRIRKGENWENEISKLNIALKFVNCS